jgi:hypothetical protein
MTHPTVKIAIGPRLKAQATAQVVIPAQTYEANFFARFDQMVRSIQETYGSAPSMGDRFRSEDEWFIVTDRAFFYSASGAPSWELHITIDSVM